MNVNYNFLVKLYSELNNDQKLKFNKSLQSSNIGISKVGYINLSLRIQFIKFQMLIILTN